MGKPLRVLILEDKPDDAELLIRKLQLANFDPDWKLVATERDYLAHLDPTLDLVLSDYSMPGFSGLRALRLLRDRGLDIPFILVSGTVGEDVAVSAMQAGAADYLLKDRLGRLGSAVTRALENRRLLDEKGRTNRQLLKTEKHLANILEQAAESIVAVNDSHQIIVFNKAAEKTFGYSAQEALGQPLDLLLPARLVKAHRELVRKFAAGPDTSRPMEHRQGLIARRKDGSEFPAEIGISKLNLDGEVIFTAMIVDITERRRAEAAVLESEARYHGILDAMMEGCQIIDFDWRYVYVNDVVAAQGKQTREELLNHTMIEVYPGIENTELFAALRQCMEERIPRRMQNQFVFPDGSIGWFELSIQPAREGIFILSTDITERKQAEKALQESEQKYSAIFDKSPFAITLTKMPELAIVGVNDAFLELFEFTRAEVIGKTSVELGITDAESRAQVAAEFQAHGRVHDFEAARFTRSSKRLDFALNLDWVTIGNEQYILTTIRDITERKQAEEALQAKNEEVKVMSQQLWQAAKLATMGELAASIAHELNNPLATVSLRAEMLQARFSPDDSEFRSLQIIDSEIKRMSSLVANLLQFSRRNASQISTIKVNEEVINALDLIQYHLRKHGILTVQELSPATQLIQADRQQLRQVFLNLFTNAADAMPLGGMLTIRTRSGEKPQAGITAPLPRQATASLGLPASGVSQVFIEVSDSGEGIPPEMLDKVWEPFYTTKSEGKGTGLGLAICRRIVQEHGGTIEIISEGIPGKGTTVRISFPAVKER